MMIQRLFSIFPNSWPGAALVLLRLSISSAVILDTARIGVGTGAVQVFAVAVWTSAALILVGLWTPISAAVAALAELLIASAGSSTLLAHAFISAVSVSLMLLGPGAWSIDAVLYGRKRLI